MAAALRNAAARLGGRAALQAANVPGRLPARLVRTRPVTPDETKDAAMRYAKIQVLKEELFDEIAEFRQEYYVSTMYSWNNEMLLYPLSVQIKPIPGDPFRSSCRRKEILNRFFLLVGLAVSINVAVKGFFWCVKEAVDPERKELLEKKKMVMDWWNKQNQCQGCVDTKETKMN